MSRWTTRLAVAAIVLASSWYLAVYGCPIPLRAGTIFYEWGLLEKGWGYWMTPVWFTENGIVVNLDRNRNLIVVAPKEIMFSRRATSREVTFFPDTANSVTISRDELLILPGDGMITRRSIPPGSAGRLRAALDALETPFGAELDRVLIAEFPELRGVISSTDNGTGQRAP